ncbi:tRNA (guanosine(18)-2'-O)-methyltransferase [Persicobacter psychrovividus]|uniref:tRNA (guanosine(18)-2'-O)-methyltransferase n=2 Tax=Persicobacter psychrovividus TaxID=387638 RepID=A0ABM7VCR6_9BACT|nr:tRNA (guanosine(18)-2'-O)-methyltransferase [Persicobacter psychrovividus]
MEDKKSIDPKVLEAAKVEYFRPYITEAKVNLLEKVMDQRTRQITVILEDVYKPHNASAVFRNCDCFGLQDLHIINNSSEYEINPNVSKGASNWVSMHRYEKEGAKNTADCYANLKAQGYTIYATSPNVEGKTLDQVDLSGKVAIAFGNEADGLSEEALASADHHLRIPMYGFTESFNISVTTALCLHHLVERLRKERKDWHLSEEERQFLRSVWYTGLVRHADLHIKRIIEELATAK